MGPSHPTFRDETISFQDVPKPNMYHNNDYDGCAKALALAININFSSLNSYFQLRKDLCDFLT